MREPSASEALWPNLRKQVPERPAQQRTNNSLAAEIWPELAPKPKARPNRDRERLLRALKETNASLSGKGGERR
jgi:hypothetical protein